MAFFLNPTAAVVLCLLSVLTQHALSLSSDAISELAVLRSQFPAGVIHPSDALLRRIISLPTPRPFHFLVFFDAKKLHSKPELSLPTLKSEFGVVSSSFLSNNPDKNSSLFFFYIEFEESQASFTLFGVNSLPHVRLIPPSAVDPITDSIKMDASDFSRLADSMAEFIASRTKLSVGPIHRPPLISKPQITIIIAAVLISAPFLVKKLITGNTILHRKITWMTGAIFVYFFSVSGAMFNIIRKTPMFLVDRKDPEKMLFFYRGSGVQLGTEGFTIGLLYTIVGLLLAFLTHVLAGVRSRNLQRSLMVVAMFVMCWAVRKVVFLNNWKTGYRVRGYWPQWL